MAVVRKRSGQRIIKNGGRFFKIDTVLLEIGQSFPGIPGERHGASIALRRRTMSGGGAQNFCCRRRECGGRVYSFFVCSIQMTASNIAGESACGPRTLKRPQPRAAVPHEYRGKAHRQECLCHIEIREPQARAFVPNQARTGLMGIQTGGPQLIF